MKKNDLDENETQTNPGKPQVTFLVLADFGIHARFNSEQEAIDEATHRLNCGDTSDFVICRVTPIKRIRRPNVIVEKL